MARILAVDRLSLGGSLDDVRAFCAVVELGSLSAAARQMGESKGGTSRRITRLERRLQAHLLARTSRAVSPTDEGVAFYAPASRALVLLADAGEMARKAHQLRRGTIRITAPLDLGIEVLPEIIAKFRTLHRHITVEMVLTEEALNLAANRIDLALRASDDPLADSSYHASLLAEVHIGLYASAKYLASHSIPKEPEDLGEHDLIVYRAPHGHPYVPLYDEEGRAAGFQARAVVRTSNYASVHTLVRAGVGVGPVPELVARASVAQNEIVRVLPGWRVSVARVNAVTLHGRDSPARVTAFRDFLRAALLNIR